MHPLDWKLLKSERLLQDRWLSLRADTCELPGGRIVAPYYVFEYPPWVTGVALTPAHEVVLVRQYRHGVQQTVLEFPGGVVDSADASPLEAMRRELLEETGYTGTTFIETGQLSANASTHTNVTYCFLATDVTYVAPPQLDETEQLETVVLPLAEVITLARQGGLPQALHTGALFFALSALGRL